jgi:hypothetical protein
VVDAAVGHGVLALVVHRLRAVAVRVQQEAAVVVRAVDRARAEDGARKPTCRPRVTGCSRSVRRMSQSSHSTISASA